MAREATRGNFVSEYNQHLHAAHTEFPELTDKNSELYKETVNILNADPQYRRIMDSLKATGRAAEKVDFSTLDPRINLRAAREAHSIVSKRNAGRPQAPNTPSHAKTGLERGGVTPPVETDADLAQLEQAAVASGDRNDWARYIKARDQRLAAGKN